MNEKFETICDILNDLGYVIDDRDIGTNTVRFNLPAVGNHDGYAIRVSNSKHNSDMIIYDGGEPIIDSYNDDMIRFTHDHRLIDHAEDYEIDKIRKILTNKTKTIIRQGKKLKKQIRFKKIEEL